MRWLALVMTLAIGVATARADDTTARTRAAQLLDEGVALYNAKQFRDALAKFESAYATFASPKILFNIAGALEQLGREAEAAQTYDRFLTETGAEPADAAAAQRTAAATEALKALDRRLGRLRLDPPPAGGITLDGLAVEARAGRPIYVAPGRHAIEAVVDGVTLATTTDVAAGEERAIDLRRGTPRSEARKPTAIGTRTVTVRSRRVWTWIAAGASVALAGGGIAAGVSADAAFERYERAETLEDWERERDATRSRATIANVCFIGAGVAAVGAGVLFFLEPREREVVVTSSDGGGVGAAVRGRF